jgi:hypothetical protein
MERELVAILAADVAGYIVGLCKTGLTMLLQTIMQFDRGAYGPILIPLLSGV